MGSEKDKSKEEVEYFRRFARESNLGIDLDSIEKKEPPIPDILCSVDGKPRYFELARMCAQDLARHVSQESDKAIWIEDPVERVLDKKLSRNYKGTVKLTNKSKIIRTNGLFPIQ
jgi:hypothetical protein